MRFEGAPPFSDINLSCFLYRVESAGHTQVQITLPCKNTEASLNVIWKHEQPASGQ